MSASPRRNGFLRAFVIAIVAGAAIVLVPATLLWLKRGSDFASHPLTNDVSVSEQLTLRQLVELKRAGFRSIVDLRPDGEAPDQPPSAEVEKLSRSLGIGFAYVPVQHGDIPAETVDRLAESLRTAERPVLLHCRSGRRAARTWALVEASRAGGLDAASIDHAVKGAGQADDDLANEIATRIAARSAP